MRPYGVIIGTLGVWLIVAGIIGLRPAGNLWNDLIVGIIVAIVGFSMARTGQGILCGVLGLWMILSAFIPSLRIGAGARWDDIIVGVILAIAGFFAPRRIGGVDARRAA
jgi:hypothetical protein